jgi:hypothetical protein
MVRKTLILIVVALIQFNLSILNAQNNNLVKLLDIEKDEVVKTTPINSNVQVETEKIIKEIDGIVKKLKPVPTKGYMIKIPLEPSYQLENKWISDLINKVIIFNSKPLSLNPLIKRNE